MNQHKCSVCGFESEEPRDFYRLMPDNLNDLSAAMRSSLSHVFGVSQAHICHICNLKAFGVPTVYDTTNRKDVAIKIYKMIASETCVKETFELDTSNGLNFIVPENSTIVIDKIDGGKICGTRTYTKESL